jgi:Protein of unknown function (DUF1569)
MARVLHDPAVRDSIRSRLERLRPDSQRKWGKMSVDQMLWHLNQSLENCLGLYVPKTMRMPLPGPLLRFAVLSLPWPKGAPTPAEYIAGERYDFATEHARCLRLLDEVTARGMDAGPWGRSAALGDISGAKWSQLLAKHFEHHLKQFGLEQ